LPAGSYGIGETSLASQQYYVNGSPAALYGIDVKAQDIWGSRPDLLISGPNEGNNLGVITPHSGTVGVTVTALNKGFL
jgi:5'-nucleotidase